MYGNCAWNALLYVETGSEQVMSTAVVTGRPHREVFAKVNASVDEGIMELVTALSGFPTLCTQASCEGGAFVTFRAGRSLEESAAFLCWLSCRLTTVRAASLTAQWGRGDSLLFTLRCSPAVIGTVAHAVDEAVTRLSAASCGNRYRESRSSGKNRRRHAVPVSCDDPASLGDLMLRDLRT